MTTKDIVYDRKKEIYSPRRVDFGVVFTEDQQEVLLALIDHEIQSAIIPLYDKIKKLNTVEQVLDILTSDTKGK